MDFVNLKHLFNTLDNSHLLGEAGTISGSRIRLKLDDVLGCRNNIKKKLHAQVWGCRKLSK